MAHFVKVFVYYHTSQPLATLSLDLEDPYLAWCLDSLPMVPVGLDYKIRLTSPQDLAQLQRIFPGVGRVNRHARFRGVLRKTAADKVLPVAARVPAPAPALASFLWRRHLLVSPGSGSNLCLNYLSMASNHQEPAETTLWFYLRSAAPVFTCTLPAQDLRLPQVLEDVRMIRHGNHVFVHLRSTFEWDRAMRLLGHQQPPLPLAS